MPLTPDIQRPGVLIYFHRDFEPHIITALMMVARAAGGMAHWREAMCKLLHISRIEHSIAVC